MTSAQNMLNARILIVDDQQFNVLLLVEMLRDVGYACITSTNDPYEVCALHKKNHYDLILLDLQMPGMDGFQVMEGLKEIETDGYLPVLVITAQPGHKLRALAAGAKDFVSKPFNLVEVQTRIHNMLEVRLLYKKLEDSNKTLEQRVLEQTVELCESEYRLKFAIEGSGDGVWDWNIQTNETQYSSRWREMLGYAEHDILPTNQEWVNRIHPDEQSFVAGVMQAYLDGKTANYVVEYRLRCKDGSYKWVLDRGIMISPIEDDKPLRMIGTHTDISERKHREQQDKKHLEELAHVTRLGLMGELASGIAHEVNQPLAAISTYTQVSLNLINTENPDLIKLSEILYKTQQQALRAGRIIHRTREFVKSHAKEHSTADVNALIYDCIDLCIAELKQNGIKLTFELEDNLPSIYVDQIQIEQVLINLIKNSVDALRNLPKKQQRHIAIHSQLTINNRIQVRVKDNGPGLDEDQQKKILTPFYTTKTEGMGMGLSISRSLIEAHEGALHFNSQPGEGSTFYFSLPCFAS
jgi:PAS domain S-box-containing protein